MSRGAFIPLLLLLACVCASQNSQYEDDENVREEFKRRPDHHLHSFLSQKIQEIDDIMRRVHVMYGDREFEDTVNISITRFNRDRLTKDVTAKSSVLDIFGGMYMLVEDNVLELHAHGDSVNMEFRSVLPWLEGFRTIKSTRIADTTLILLTFDDSLQLYSTPNSGSWSTVAHAQTFTNDALMPIAAEFVHCLGRVYLAVAYADQYGGSVNSLIYEWNGSHMDEIHEMATSGAVDLAVIVQSDNFYVAIAQKPQRISKHCITIYKVTPGGPLHQHSILTASPRRLLAYKDFHMGDQDYLLILHDGGNGKVLKLRDDQFIHHHDVELARAPEVATIGYLEAVPVLFYSSGNNSILSILTPEGLEPHTVIPLDGPISTLDILEPEYQKYRLITTSVIEKYLMTTIVNLVVTRNIHAKPRKVDPLQQILNQLTAELDMRQNIIDELSAKIHTIETADDVTYDGVLSLPNEVKLSLSKIDRLVIETRTPLILDQQEMLSLAQSVLEEIAGLEEELPNIVYKNKPIVIDYPVIIEEDMIVDILEADTISAMKVNGKEFTPEHFVMDNDLLRLEEGELIDELHIGDLEAPDIFMPGILNCETIRHVEAENLVIPSGATINGISLDDIVLNDYSGLITGTKVIDDIVADTVYAENIEEVNIDDILKGPPQVENVITLGDVQVQELIVETVNGINISKFMNSLFLKGIHDTVEGDIEVNGQLQIDELITEHFQGIPADELLTKSTDQVINGNVYLHNIQFDYGYIGLINGINLTRDAALLYKHNIIETPVTIDSLNIQNNLILNCDEKHDKYCNLLDINSNYLVQVYEGPVVIDGSVTVHDVQLSDEALVTVEDEPFHTDFEQVFWMKSKKQRIPDGFMFAAGLTIPSLQASHLNGVPLERYATIYTDFTNIPVKFDELHVNGNFDVQPGTQCASVVELGKDVVTSHGDVIITGTKIFLDTLQVNNLNVETINGIDMDDIVLLNETRNKEFLGSVKVESIEVKGDLRAYCDIETKLLNEYPLKKIVDRALKVDEDAYLESVTFTKSLQGTNILIESGPIADAIKNIDTLFDGINVTIAGDIKVANGINQVKYINGIDFESYIGQVVDKNMGGLVAGKKIFSKGLEVEEQFHGKFINGIDFQELIKNALRRNGAQVITGNHKINNLYVDNLQIQYLNNLTVDNLVDASQPIIINSSLVFENINVFGQLTAQEPFDLKEFKASLNNLKPRCWAEVEINGGINWEIPGAISDLVENAVHAYHENIITGNVKFTAPVTTNNLISEEFIDGVDIQFIANDAVLKSAPDQVITGKKTFTGPTTINKLYVIEALYCENIPNVDLQKINDTMARKYGDNYFEGHVTFSGNISANFVKAKHITGIPHFDDIFSTDKNMSIKNLEAKSLHLTGDLIVDTVNGINITDFLDSIVLLDAPYTQHLDGEFLFDEMEVDNLNAETINNVSVSNIAFSKPNVGYVQFDDDSKIDGSGIDGSNDYDYDVEPVLLQRKSVKAVKGDDIDIKQVVFKALSQIDAEVDAKLVILKDIEMRSKKRKSIYKNNKATGPKFLYLELVKYIHLNISIAHSTATCRPNNCTIVTTFTNLDCLLPQREEACTPCQTRREITVDPTNWSWSAKNKSVNQTTFLVSGFGNKDVVEIVTFYSKDGDACRIKNTLKWIPSSVYEAENEKTLDLSKYVKETITSVNSIPIGNVILVIVDEKNEQKDVKKTVIVLLDQKTRSLTHSQEILADHITTAKHPDNKAIVVFSTRNNTESEIVELSFDKESKRCDVTQKIRLGAQVVVGLELVNIKSTNGKYQTVLCMATSDGAVNIYTTSTQGWELRSSSHVVGANGLIHFTADGWPYLLVTSFDRTAVLSLTSTGL